MSKIIGLVFIISLFSCKSSKENDSNTVKQKILGIWTDGWPEDGTLDFKKDSVYYLPGLAVHYYLIKGDSLLIDYPNTTYGCEVVFRKDSLIMNSNGDILKMWRVQKNEK